MSADIVSLVHTDRKQIFPLPTGFNNPVTAWIWGGGGGGGGNDTGTGGKGAAGQLIKVTFNANVGDILEVSIGGAGGAGAGGASASGGTAGSSFINDIPTSYGGGRGGNSGPSGSSGSGGGGGGATVLSLFRAIQADRIIIAVAGGGAGGGGAGNRGLRNGVSAIPTSSGSAAYNSGQNGQDCGDVHNDGGGGGGGGGGYYGGAGGNASSSYDEGAAAGITGSSWSNANVAIVSSSSIHPGTTTAPANIDGFDVGTYANGGTTAQAGGTGFAILNLIVAPYPIIKVGGSWIKADAGWVKAGDQWRPITSTYYKINNQWKRVSSADIIDFTNANAAVNYGPGGTRSYPAP
jgi:hypothetical protein